MKAYSISAAAALAAALGVSPAYATDYRFAVKSPKENKVVLWSTGSIDPGQEYLRAVTGTNNPGASVSDYNPGTDANLRVEKMEGVPAVIQGVPVVGPILKALGLF